MNIAHRVESVYSHDDLCQVEAGHVFRKCAFIAVQQRQEVAARVKLHHQVQLLVILKKAVQFLRLRFPSNFSFGCRAISAKLCLQSIW